MPSLMVLFQVGAWTAAMIVAGKAVYEVRLNRLQRASELRWRRANAARDLLSEIHHHAFAKDAVTMMDWCQGEHKYQIKPDKQEMIRYADVCAALAKAASPGMSEKEEYICDCFDWFLYYLDRIEHYVRIQLIDFDDVKSPFRQYARIIGNQLDVFAPLMKLRAYRLVEPFVQRYSTEP